MNDNETNLMKWTAFASSSDPEAVGHTLNELAKEIARLRSVCRKCSGVLMRQYDKMTLDQVQQLPWLSAAIVTVAQDMGACGDGASGKEATDAM